ncbi:MAG: TRAP transporter large permease, partial [Geminicoccaceae bacterium]|nr:TRAP transporter large permease [Geminicoccaceae bacterium]
MIPGAAVLSPGQAAGLLFGLFFAFLTLRVPVAFALGLACLPPLFIEPRLSPLVLVQETFNAYNSFILLAVPFFLLTANLMNVGGITDRLVRLSRAMVGHCPGGLAQINVVLSIFFAGISGSSTADAASQSKIFIEAQRKEGYDDSFSVAITAVSAVLAVIVPPSILMIVWGGILTTSIGGLFLAGIVPGLLIGLVQMATVHAYATARGYPTYPRASWGELARALVVSAPALTTPFIIIGGKVFGWFTATESACIAVLYAATLSLLVYREMDLK